ncbi:uncharacterized protein N7483_000134 [Penicillium malachiteum]|uniref:uncharacterized protein n=1 Tax=Penicillium malachiteum TaxID=1324776 RepID=UPI0025481B3C|nr:uncharacterized protein N7483_000134 [Penicillium malachiteum]KAJ5735009.1 hypothetical protein N7483_000134 [Penicillium malachiteum]
MSSPAPQTTLSIRARPEISRGFFEYIFHHVFLPPKLPDGDDYNSIFEALLLKRLVDSLRSFVDEKMKLQNHNTQSAFEFLIVTMKRLIKILGAGGEVSENKLTVMMATLQAEGGILPILVREQNAGILMSRKGDKVNIEFFELSARNEAVIETVGRLVRTFPGPGLAVDQVHFNNPEFLEAVGQTIACLSHQKVARTKPKVKKAQQLHNEDRDTTDPMMITQFLMSILRPLSNNMEDVQIEKRIREEVMWNDSRKPWRRSALWIFVRVTLQAVLVRSLNQVSGRQAYKEFMVFFMSDLARKASSAISNEQLFLMNAKVTRRLLKLDAPLDPDCFSILERNLKFTSRKTKNQWLQTMMSDRRSLDLGRLALLDTQRDTQCDIPALEKYLQEISTRGQNSESQSSFSPAFSINVYQDHDLPDLSSHRDPGYGVFHLATVEEWVEKHLDRWITVHQNEESTCGALANLIQAYHSAAKMWYSGNPKATSIMLLTLLELWIACDKTAISVHGMLADYDPCIPAECFQSLLLPFPSQMNRMAKAEDYLSHRQCQVKYGGQTIFNHFGTSSSFSVRYFNSSPQHQQLLARIEKRAREDRSEKLAELRQKQERYRSLMQLYSQLECEYEEVTVYYHRRGLRTHTVNRHKNSCIKCGHKSQADSISITVHEWPLPLNTQEAKSVVFELMPPETFSKWRDTTIFFLLDCLYCDYSAKRLPRYQYPLHHYSGLYAYRANRLHCQRISLLSEIKPHDKTHRGDRDMADVTPNDICVNNGLKLRYFDSQKDCFITDFERENQVEESCTYQLPPASSALQKFLSRPAKDPNGPSPNSVISTQSSAPKTFSLEEYRSLAALPLGLKIQWQNILLELCSGTLDMKKVETAMFILQIANQVGPLDGESENLRQGHAILEDDAFTFQLLSRINEVKDSIKANWEMINGLSNLVLITQKVFLLSPFTLIKERCLETLKSLREIAFGWVGIVKGKANETVDADDKSMLIGKAAHIALVCSETFNLQDPPLVFLSSAEISLFLQCSMVICDGQNCLSMQAGSLSSILAHRWQVQCYRNYRFLVSRIVAQSDRGIDLAIAQAWVAYEAGEGWSRLDGFNHHHWLVTRQKDSEIEVHFDLLTGDLRVNGLPLARLPADYESHHTYAVLFGKSQLEVMPSDLPGMQFSCRSKYRDYNVHLSKTQPTNSMGSALHVTAVKGRRTWQFVSPTVFEGILPDSFINNYVHWYSVEHGHVEFRPINDPWSLRRDDWQLCKFDSGWQPGWELKKEGQKVVAMGSSTSCFISEILKPIEKASRVHCVLHDLSATVHIILPRLRLEFTLKNRSTYISSRQYPDMVIDKDQSLDSLIGLSSKLLLGRPGSRERLVLIPEGDLSISKDEGHVKVDVLWENETQLQAYAIDTQIGYLADNGSLRSKLFLSCLHAVTSSCLPDPLTRKTGTEQALSILRSASLRSFTYLGEAESRLLENLASLTPLRQYYPVNLRVMQQVIWKRNLPVMSQHPGFLDAVESIRDQNKRTQFLYPDVRHWDPSVPHIDKVLSQRDQIRTSCFRVSGFGAEQHTCTHDQFYRDLKSAPNADAALRSFTISEMICKDISRTRPIVAKEMVNTLWKLLSTRYAVRGRTREIQVQRLKYDGEWMLNPEEFLTENWLPIHQLAVSEGQNLNKFRIMTWLAAIAFSGQIEMSVVEIMTYLFQSRDTSINFPPDRNNFQLHKGFSLNSSVLDAHIIAAQLSNTPRPQLSQNQNETQHHFDSRVQRVIDQNRDNVFDRAVNHFSTQWPSRSLEPLDTNVQPIATSYLNTTQLMDGITQSFNDWMDNWELREYLTEVVTAYQNQRQQPVHLAPYSPESYQQGPSNKGSKRGFVTFNDCLQIHSWSDTNHWKEPELGSHFEITSEPTKPSQKISALIDSLRCRATSQYEEWYVEQLEQSVLSLNGVMKNRHLHDELQNLQQLTVEHLHACQKHLTQTHDEIIDGLLRFGDAGDATDSTDSTYSTDSTTSDDYRLSFLAAVNSLAFDTGQYPRLSTSLLLEQLSRQRWQHLDAESKEKFTQYGCAIAAVQRAERLCKLANSPDELIKEIQNPGHTNWDILEFPETLLLEVENQLLIRENQEEIARVMRESAPGGNYVLQLNMGEGKSTVIVPIVAASLADGSHLVRVTVAKPQSRQMMDILIAKLGGLLGRRIYYMPISRSLNLNNAQAIAILQMCRECMSQCGVLLIQPEHILSLKLMCLEFFIAGKLGVANSVLQILKFLKENSYDIVDESDENFNVKFELIYTMGAQCNLEFGPHRWQIIQELLGLVEQYSKVVSSEFPDAIEICENQNYGFPRVRLLDDNARESLFDHIGRHICENGMSCLPVSRQPQSVRDAVRAYIMERDPSLDDIASVHGDNGFWGQDTRNALLLVRGLLAEGVLAFCLQQKRWRVNFGPASNRNPSTKLCVPYRAKDSPSLRSEFSHPDVVILLTCLHYYYAGLDDEDLFLAFQALSKTDQADIEYQAWVSDAPMLPPAYHQLVGVNLEDRHHCIKNIFPFLRLSKAAVDFFLNQIVFPKELKAFPDKLSASGWDVGEIKTHPTVGFSGTNDSRKVLPLDVCQLDIPEQTHTNALVIGNILREENSVAYTSRSEDPDKTDTKALIDQILQLKPSVRVILDVGAQFLELNNEAMAQYLLRQFSLLDAAPHSTPRSSQAAMQNSVQAVVFVNDKDQICVIDHSGLVEPLQISPFARQMEACFIFLDEVHTRGIDLKLPKSYRAAVTLGPKTTKDKLVQACMRMRKLGHGQSVVFCIPTEVQNRIFALRGPDQTSKIEVSEVLQWAVVETWGDMKHNISLWALQGSRYERQRSLWDGIFKSESSSISPEQAEEFLEEEYKTIEDRYSPLQDNTSLPDSVGEANERLGLIDQRCQEFGSLEHDSAALQEEQERELAPEIECEREVERPQPIPAMQHQIHPDLLHLIRKGQLREPSSAWQPAFKALSSTSAATHLDIDEFPTGLLATADFCKTVQAPSRSSCNLDCFQRPVRWVLTFRMFHEEECRRDGRLIIISPYEANELIDEIRDSMHVTLEVYGPRQNRAFAPLDDLRLYTVPQRAKVRIPESLRIQLDLFSGHLYLTSYEEYRQVCKFLGVSSVATTPDLLVAADGFIVSGNEASRSSFSQSPLKFLRILMSQIRKDSKEISKTHIGKIIEGSLLSQSDFPEQPQN